MHEHDERPGYWVGLAVKPGRQPVAVGHPQQQPLASRQIRGSAAQGIAQGLQVTPKPRRPFTERQNRSRRICPHRRCDPLRREAD